MIQAVHNELPEASDSDLERRIVNFLYQRNIPQIQRISVDVSNGSVVLQGRVNSIFERQLCLNCCQRVAGVVQVIDRLQFV